MRRLVVLAVVAALVAVAVGCVGGGSQHVTLSARDALAQAREDGCVKVSRQAHPEAWWCDRRAARSDVPGWTHYVTPNYAIHVEDKRVPPGPGNTGRIIMMVVVFRNDSIARRCAEGGIYQNMHIPVHGC